MSRVDTVLDSLIAESDSALLKKLDGDSLVTYSVKEIAEIEQEILRGAPANVNLPDLINTLRSRIAARSPGSIPFLRTKAVFSYPTASNPHADRSLHRSDKVFSFAKEWLRKRTEQRESGVDSASSLFVNFIVSAIVNFQVLHSDFLLPIVSSLHDERFASFHPTIIGIPISLPYGQQKNAETRLLIAPGKVCTALRRFFAHSDA